VRSSNQKGVGGLDADLSRNKELSKGEAMTNSALNCIGINIIALTRHHV